MTEEIYLSELECPHCDYDLLNESWNIEIAEDQYCTTKVRCEGCGKIFYVETNLSVVVRAAER